MLIGMNALMQSELPFPVRRGKVRDVYDLGDCLLIVATDRISAFDVIMPNGIPDKGRILTTLSLFWFQKFASRFEDRKSTRLNSSHSSISYAVFCLKKKKKGAMNNGYTRTFHGHYFRQCQCFVGQGGRPGQND